MVPCGNPKCRRCRERKEFHGPYYKPFTYNEATGKMKAGKPRREAPEGWYVPPVEEDVREDSLASVMAVDEAKRSVVSVRRATNRPSTSRAMNGSSANEVGGRPSQKDPPISKSDGPAGTLIENAPPCTKENTISPRVRGTEVSSNAPRSASSA